MKKQIVAIALFASFSAMAAAPAVPNPVTSWNSNIMIKGQDGAEYDMDTVTRLTVANTLALANLPTPTNGVDGKDGTNGLDGKDGRDGTNGLDGKDGRDGTNGLDGKDGRDGAQGIQGIQGAKGDKGDAGHDGKNGVNGTNGKDGINGTNGVDGKNGADGKDGVTTTITRVDTATQNKVDAQGKTLDKAVKDTAATGQDVRNLQSEVGGIRNDMNRKFDEMDAKIDLNEKKAEAGIAGVAAMASIPQVNYNQTVAIGAGVGYHGTEQAIAVGASVRLNDAWTTKASVAADTQDGVTVGAGVAFGF